MDVSIFTTVLAVLGSILASSGFWAFMEHRRDKDTAVKRMLVGIGHDRIVYLSTQYIERGYITQEEYTNLMNYLYTPYHELGGGGVAQRMVQEVEKLPIRSHDQAPKDRILNAAEQQGL